MAELERAEGRDGELGFGLTRALTRALISVLAAVLMLVVVAWAAWSLRAQSALELEAPQATHEAEPGPGADRIALSSSAPACPDAPAPTAIGGELELAIFLGAGVAPVRAAEVRSALERFHGPYAIEVRAAAEPVTIANESMFVGTFAELRELEGDEGATAAWLYRDLRAFLLTHARPRAAGPRVNVVVVRDIVHPRAAAASTLGDLVGLTLAPELLAGEQGGPLAAMGLGDFTPTVLLSDRHLERMPDAAFTAAVAHELGHAMGLVHVEARWNLMAVGRHGCTPGLDDAQLERLRGWTLGSGS